MRTDSELALGGFPRRMERITPEDCIDLHRLQVPGGWVLAFDSKDGSAVAAVFIADPDWTWELEAPSAKEESGT